MSIATDTTCAPAWPASPTSDRSGLDRPRRGGAARARSWTTSSSRPSSTTTRALRDAARWVIWSASQALGCGSASIHELYRARGRGEVPATAFTVPGHQRARRGVPDRAPGVRRGPRARRRDGDLRDRQERDGLHRPAAGRVHRRHPGRRPARGLARRRSSSRATTSSSTPRSGPRIPRPSSTGCATSPARRSAPAS